MANSYNHTNVLYAFLDLIRDILFDLLCDLTFFELSSSSKFGLDVVKMMKRSVFDEITWVIASMEENEHHANPNQVHRLY